MGRGGVSEQSRWPPMGIIPFARRCQPARRRALANIAVAMLNGVAMPSAVAIAMSIGTMSSSSRPSEPMSLSGSGSGARGQLRRRRGGADSRSRRWRESSMSSRPRRTSPIELQRSRALSLSLALALPPDCCPRARLLRLGATTRVALLRQLIQHVRRLAPALSSLLH